MTRELVTFQLDDARYGVDVSVVQEVLGDLPMTAVPLAPAAVAGLVNLRGRAVLAVDLRRRLGKPSRSQDQARSTVILRTAGQPVCLVVDQIGSVEQVDDSQFAPPPDTLTGSARRLVEGAYKLDQELLLVLDTHAALDLEPDDRRGHPSGVLS